MLYILNATVIPIKVSQMFSLIFIYVLFEDEQKLGVGIFVAPIVDLTLALI